MVTRRDFLKRLGLVGAAAAGAAAGMGKVEEVKAETPAVDPNPNISEKVYLDLDASVDSSRYWIAHYRPNDIRMINTISTDEAYDLGVYGNPWTPSGGKR